MRFKLKDFPIGSVAYWFKLVDIQNNPKTRRPGERKFYQGYAFSRVIISHHIKNSQNPEYGLVGTQYDNSDEGFDVENSRFAKEGFLLIPEFVYEDVKNRSNQKLSSEQKLILLLRDPKTSSSLIADIIKNTKFELSKPHARRVYYSPTKNQKIA